MGSISSRGSTTVTGNYSRLRRRILLVVLVVLLIAAGVVAAVVTRAGGGQTAADPATAAQLPELGDARPVLAGLSGQAPVPDPDTLAAELGPLLSDPTLGSGVSAQVVDVATGKVLLDQDADEPVTPASTAKLLTAAAALITLDAEDTIETTVVAGSAPGEVVLVGGGDPTLSRTSPSQSYPGAATVADLAAQVLAALPAGTAITRVVVDNSLFTGPLTASGWGADDAPSSYAAPVTATAVDGARVRPGAPARSAQPGVDAGSALADALGAPRTAVSLGAAPKDARTLGTVRSAPIARLVEQMLSASDNVLAEAIARQIALASGQPASFDGGARAITEALAGAGVDVTDVVLSDGSGLSGENRVPVEVLVALLTGASDGSLRGASALLSGLPVAGYEGTLADRGDAAPATAPGSVRAKTGTLLGVNALAGTALTTDRRLLAFAVVADGATADESGAEAALDDVAAALAGCGCR